MAGTLLHITLASKALEVNNDALVEEAARAHPDDFALGCVFVDLPYYDKLWISGVRAVLGLPIQYNAWGTLIHLRTPRGLFLEILGRAKATWSRAFALGCLTHYAVDLVFHPEIHSRVAEVADGARPLDSEHKHIEDDMDLHCHYELLGHSGLGNRYARDSLSLIPSDGWVRLAGASIRAIHASAPANRHLIRWNKNLTLFGIASSSPRAPWVKTLPADDPELQEKSIDLAGRSITLASEYMTAGASYLRGDIDSTGFASMVPDRSMIDGGKADPPRG